MDWVDRTWHGMAWHGMTRANFDTMDKGKTDWNCWRQGARGTHRTEDIIGICPGRWTANMANVWRGRHSAGEQERVYRDGDCLCPAPPSPQSMPCHTMVAQSSPPSGSYHRSNTDIFSTNKRLLDEVASVPSKRLRNKISGCECHPIER